MLHALSEFIDATVTLPETPPSYWYEGQCPQTGARLRLPRSPLIEAIAHQLMAKLAEDGEFEREGKMYGVLLVETITGEKAVLQAFSGLLQGRSQIEGWVPPIPGREEVTIAEAQTLAELNAIRQEVMTLENIPERQQYQQRCHEFEQQLNRLDDILRKRKQERERERRRLEMILEGAALAIALDLLNRQSQKDKIVRKELKQKRNLELQPLAQTIEQADERLKFLKQYRRDRSRQLQQQMHETYRLLNFLGTSIALQQLMPHGMPTGTGECCAPKLLHYAATHDLKPIALAEFWWGSAPGRPTGVEPPKKHSDKVRGEFYGACLERCQPLMGFLLSGLPPVSIADLSVPILYEDEWLIAVNKPAGLLSIPGLSGTDQDSVLTRLRSTRSDGLKFVTVHRLDRETSGILLLARHPQAQQQLHQQFQQRQVDKTYEALLAGIVARQAGTIDLPIGRASYQGQPRRQIDWYSGKPSLTYFQVLNPSLENFSSQFLSSSASLSTRSSINSSTRPFASSSIYPPINPSINSSASPPINSSVSPPVSLAASHAKSLSQSQNIVTTRIEFKPVTGRTHQLRVHAIAGLGAVILGDRLYGCQAQVDRLYLHARELRFQHPQSGKTVHLETTTPF